MITNNLRKSEKRRIFESQGLHDLDEMFSLPKKTRNTKSAHFPPCKLPMQTEIILNIWKIPVHRMCISITTAIKFE